LMTFVQKHDLMLIEDTCESLGTFSLDPNTKSSSKWLGTYGDFGTYSFYFSHHITSGEGGMVVCKTEEDYNFVRCLRAHGWTRHLTNRLEVEAKYADIDSRFLFINVGYNLRPLEVQGAMLSVQLTKLDAFNACRRDNMSRIQKSLERHPMFVQVMTLMSASEGTDPAWFGIGARLHRAYAHQLAQYLQYLTEHGVENRPVISGNFTRQPCISSYGIDAQPHNYPGAECVHMCGFFIGVHQVRIDDSVIEKLVGVMLSFPFQPQRIVLVTGANGMLGSYVRELMDGGANVSSPDKFIWLTRLDGDLRVEHEVETIFKRYQPTHVLHCAASLSSIHEMTKHPVGFWLDNVTVNNNILRCAFSFQAWIGPVKVVSVLSTTMIPKSASYPVNSNDLFSGPLHEAAEAYSFSKQALAKLTAWYRHEHKAQFSCILPGNFYGSYGDFNTATAPLVNALIAKIEQARELDSQSITIMGTGQPLRQVMFARDLAQILLWALFNFDDDMPLFVAGVEHSVATIARAVCDVCKYHGDLTFDSTAVDGPLRRTIDIQRFRDLHPNFEFTSLQDGISQTLAWYRTCPK